jgi:hypothetical protein
MAGAFLRGWRKTASLDLSAHHFDKAGLGLLAVAPAYHGYKAIKRKDKGEGALAASELGGLGLLYHAVNKAHK